MDETWPGTDIGWAPPERPFDWLLCTSIFVATLILLSFARKSWAPGKSRFLCLILPVFLALLVGVFCFTMEDSPLLLLKLALLATPFGLTIGLQKSPERLAATVLSALSIASGVLIFAVLPRPQNINDRRIVAQLETRDLIKQAYSNFYCAHKRWPKDWSELNGPKSMTLDETAQLKTVTQTTAGPDLTIVITFGKGYIHQTLKAADIQCKAGHASNNQLH